MKRVLRLILSTIFAGVVLPIAAMADSPEKPIKIITDSAPGGVNDLWARKFAQLLSSSMGQSFLVENKPGASGTLAAEALAKSEPNGYTLMYGGFNPIIVYPNAGGATRYDAMKDFAPIAPGAGAYPIIAISPTNKSKSVKALVDEYKATGKDLTCSALGNATMHHFLCAQFERATGIKTRVVHYKSAPQAAIDNSTGLIDLTTGVLSELQPLIKAGRVVPLVVFGPTRLPNIAGTPTMAESGYPRLETPAFGGFYAPAKTPPEVLDALNKRILAAMQDKGMQELMSSLGGIHMPVSQKQFAIFVRSEQVRWGNLAKQFSIEAE